MTVKQCYAGGSTDARPGLRVRLSYNEAVLDRLKQAIPSEGREWDPAAGEWWVADEYTDVLRRILPAVAVFLDQPRLL